MCVLVFHFVDGCVKAKLVQIRLGQSLVGLFFWPLSKVFFVDHMTQATLLSYWFGYGNRQILKPVCTLSSPNDLQLKKCFYYHQFYFQIRYDNVTTYRRF